MGDCGVRRWPKLSGCMGAKGVYTHPWAVLQAQFFLGIWKKKHAFEGEKMQFPHQNFATFLISINRICIHLL
jgi:hypothetical protein